MRALCEQKQIGIGVLSDVMQMPRATLAKWFSDPAAQVSEYVLIENKPEGKVTASLIGRPHMTAQGSTEAEAVSSLRRSFIAHLRDAKVIPLALDVERPWLQTAGMFKDDTFADELDAVIAEYRRERDAEDVPEGTEDHAASRSTSSIPRQTLPSS